MIEGLIDHYFVACSCTDLRYCNGVELCHHGNGCKRLEDQHVKRVQEVADHYVASLLSQILVVLKDILNELRQTNHSG